MGEPTEAQINDACMWYRHDFGLLRGQEREMVRFEAKEWLRAWGKALPATPAEAHRITMKQDQSGVFIAHDVGADIMTQGPTELEAWERLAATIAVETYGAPLDAAPAEDVRAGALILRDMLDYLEGEAPGVTSGGQRNSELRDRILALIPEART